MRKLPNRALPVVLTALLATAPATQASTIGGFTDLYLFGDSLTDTGNFHAVTGRVGGPETFGRPYYDGRRSNGPLWSDYLEADFEAKGLTAKNYAWIGATAVPDGDFIPDLPAQIGGFAISGAPLTFDDRPLAGLWFGANDVLEGVEAGTAEASGIAAADAVADGALALAGLGIRDFLIFNLPDLGETPLYNLYEGTPVMPMGAKAAAAAGSAAFNSAIAARIGELRAAGYNVIDIDMAALFDALLADPNQFGLEDATFPCLFLPGTGAFFGQPDTCSGEQTLDRAFYDWLHPNSVVHAELAGVVRRAGVVQDPLLAAPLPAPALLLLGSLAILFAKARRGRRSRDGSTDSHFRH
jgi:outer membrane lipase/esterase